MGEMSTIFDMVAGKWLPLRDQTGTALLDSISIPHNEMQVARLATQVEPFQDICSLPADLADVSVDDFLKTQSV